MFPIGVNTWIWESPLTGGALAALAPRIRGFGADAVELPVEELDDWDPVAARKVLDDNGLTAAAVCAVIPPGRDLVAADPPTVARAQDYLRRCIDAAAQVGAPVVAGPMYAGVGRTWRMDPGERALHYAELRAALEPVAEHAHAAGVRLAVEPLNRYETSLLNTVAQAMEALDGLPTETVGLALDVYHMNIEEHDLVRPVAAAGSRIAHVQVCANDRGAPGTDHLDWTGFLTALRDAGYTGSLSIESFTAHNATIAVAASIWRPLARSQDAIAADGIAFLRRMTESLSS
ncbi:sugar phosphate isomerase/epimerase family protein [Actinomadura alba]|uniref:Sugar phosphate isomerase/epimerase n=1 Tax=Actinomadura alba TaxID=406431 RepID=A0ABR7LZ87_9ACTN|nr:sugar phosphate isomerase/epimerase family protein [Actinomadura alba]MBC6470085.1 sugar phosphate isomerase/epimerase [Actinomadura alba]